MYQEYGNSMECAKSYSICCWSTCVHKVIDSRHSINRFIFVETLGNSYSVNHALLFYQTDTRKLPLVAWMEKVTVSHTAVTLWCGYRRTA